MQTNRCPLCGDEKLAPSWLTLSFEGSVFDFAECLSCGSLACSPMPDEAVLARMYDESYCEDPATAGEPASSLEKFSEVLEFIDRLPRGQFIDYGCGDGKLLVEMRSRGWDVLGVDFNPDLAFDLKAKGITVLGANDQPLCKLKGNWSSWDFTFMHDDVELARVSKKWAGLGKELFTTADNYMLSISPAVPPDNPIRGLILGAVMCIDLVLKE